jgi:hypothetical protein
LLGGVEIHPLGLLVGVTPPPELSNGIVAIKHKDD